MNRFLRACSLAIILTPFAGLPAFADASSTGLMSLTGTGVANAAPDMANLSTGVIVSAQTAAKALAANTRAMTKLIAVIKSSGVADKDIQTSNFSVQPQYVYSDVRDANGYTKEPLVTSYQVSNTVSVRVRDLTSLGSVLDQMVSAGSNTINSISFSITDPRPLLDEARELAVKDARDKAELYSAAADICVLGIKSITENGRGSPEPRMMRAMEMDFAAVSVPVEAGEVGFSVDVSISWEIKQGYCFS